MKLISVSRFKQVNIKTRTNIQKPMILEHKNKGKKPAPTILTETHLSIAPPKQEIGLQIVNMCDLVHLIATHRDFKQKNPFSNRAVERCILNHRACLFPLFKLYSKLDLLFVPWYVRKTSLRWLGNYLRHVKFSCFWKQRRRKLKIFPIH